MRIVHPLILGAVCAALWTTGVVAQEAPAPTPTLPAADAAAPEPTPAPAERSPHERIVFLLSGYEYFPTRADLDAVAPAAEVAAILRGVAADVDGRPTLRLRAVDALGYYDDESTVAFLGALVGTAPAADLPRRKLRTAGLLRHHAVTALARSQRGAAVAAIEPLLGARDVQLALTAVDALGKHGGAQGRALLAQAAESSPHDLVRREAARWVK